MHGEQRREAVCSVIRVGEEIGIRLRGEIDRNSAPAINDFMQVIVDNSGRIVVDLSGVTFGDSHLANVIVKTYNAMVVRRGRASIELRNPPSTIARILELTGITTLDGVTIEYAVDDFAGGAENSAS